MYLAVVRRVLGEIHLRLGRPHEAVVQMQASVKLIKDYRLPHEYVMGAFSGQAEACLAARAAAPGTSTAQVPTLRQIQKLCRQGIRKGQKFRNWLGYAYRVSALCEWSRGRRRAAVRLFQRSIEACSAIGAEYDLAMTYCDLGRLLLTTGDPAHRVCLEESQRLFMRCGAAHDLARVEILLSEVPAPEVVGRGSILRPHVFLRRLALTRPAAN
jgi:hypothetical protein